jgi:hypothetical protein
MIQRFLKLILIVVISVSMIQCKCHKKGKSIVQDGKIQMQKTSCFGRCPVYLISINSDGRAEYLGTLHVKKLGKFEKQLNEQEKNDLFSAFNNSSIWEMKDEYLFNATDIPSTIVTYSYNGKTKTIKDQKDAPEKLKELEKMVEAIAESDGWKQLE